MKINKTNFMKQKQIILNKLEKLQPHNLNCNVFSIYDYDGYTMQELLCQFFTRINELTDNVNTTLELVEWLVNEGLEIAVIEQLTKWLNDGTIADLINVTIFEELNNKLDGAILDIDNLEIDNKNIHDLINELRNDVDNNATNISKNASDILSIIDRVSVLESFTSGVCIIRPSMTITEINTYLSDNSYSSYIFEKGTYVVNKDESITITGSNKNVYFNGAVIVQRDTLEGKYVMLEIRKCQNINIYTPVINGQKPNETPDEVGEWGYGIEISQCYSVNLFSPRIFKTTGDGIYIGYKWNEPNPLEIQNNNINIYEPKINSCSRNGISICSGDNIKVVNPVIDDIFRKLPKSGIDIEPENGDESIIHMSNIQIINPVTSTVDSGIIVSSVLNTRNDITIINHRVYNAYVGLFIASYKGSGKLFYKGAIHNEPKYNSIKIANKFTGSILSIDDLTIMGRGEQGSESIPENSSMIVFKGEVGGVGDISINNVNYIHTNNFYNIYTVYGTGEQFTNVKLTNISGEKLPTLNIPNLYTPLIKNVDTWYDTNYGILDYNSANCPSDMTISQSLQADTVRNINANIPDGIYTIGANRSSGFMLTINFIGLTVLGQVGSIFKSNKDGTRLVFKKVGTDIIVLNNQGFEIS